MFHAALICLAMSPPIRFVLTAVLVLLVIDFTRGEGCHAVTHPISNDDFQISCEKTPFTGVTVQIECLKTHYWGDFPKNNISLKSINVLLIKDCSFPQGLTLFNLTESLLKIGRFEVIEFENFNGSPAREFFDNFKMINVVKLTSGNVGDNLPANLFGGVDVENFEVFNMGLTAIPDNFFKNSMNPTNLETLDIVYNQLNKLKRNDFLSLDGLKNLSLFGNEVVEIEEHTFDHLVNLKMLELSKNTLNTLPHEIFKRLINLEILNLSENDFEHLPADLLRNNSKLHTLKLNYNRGELASLPDGFLKNLSRLQNVELIGNGFKSLPVDVFQGLKSLKELDLRENNLLTLPKGIFESTSNLHTLYLSNNSLEFLPDKIFEDAGLEFLSLEHNLLTNITGDLVPGLSDLIALNVSYNRINYLFKDFCQNMQQLKNLDISHNELNLELDPMNFSILANCAYLRVLNVSYNRIEQMSDDWVRNGNLQEINFEGNKITQLDINSHLILNYGSIVNLKNNQIHTVHMEFEELENYKIQQEQPYQANPTILLNGNPLNCTCKLLGLSRYFDKKRRKELKLHLDIHADELRCSEPSKFANLKFKNIQPSQLSCLKISKVQDDACSGTCECWDYPGKPLLFVDCSNRNLNKVPANIINSGNWTIELNMSGNKLRETPALNRTYLLNVTALDLSNNSISTVTPKVFSKSIRILKLHNNNITRLDANVLSTLTSNTALNQLTLYNNKWECTCNSRGFLNFIKKKITSNWTNLHEIVCENNGRALYTLSSNELCENTEKMVLIVVLICLVITCFGLLMGVIAALYYKYENEIKVWLYAKQWCLWLITEDELDKNKQYDAFISFSHKDEDFVKKEIVAKLEEGPNPFKLCLHYRDWLAGEWIPNLIAHSVEDSRRTLIVLSPNFIESIWGRIEFRTAHCQALSEGRARVIVILHGDIGNMENLDPELKAYLSMNNYIKWGDPWFWDKLKYALPHRYEPKKKRKSKNARLIELHLAQAMNNHHHDGGSKVEIIPLPKINESSNDSVKLLDSTGEDERMTLEC